MVEFWHATGSLPALVEAAAELTHLFETLVRTYDPENLDPVAHNRAAWDHEVDQGNEWTRPVEPDVIARARAGDWSVVLIGRRGYCWQDS